VRLLSVTVENYRVVKAATVVFDPSRTVVGGRQEIGKSTIVEAIHHALFLKSRVTGNVLKAMQSDLHEGHPTVTLALECGGRSYTIRKVFAGAGATSATLLTDDGPAAGGAAATGGRTLRGEEAEARIHDLLRAEDIGGGRGVDGRLRMQWAHLWVWQGTSGSDPVKQANEERPAEQLRDRLGRLDGGGVLESPLDAAAARQIDARLAATFRDNGGARSGSELARSEEEHAQAEAAFTAAAALVGSLDTAVEAIDAADRSIAAAGAGLAVATEDLAGVRERLRTAGDLRIRLAEEQAVASAATVARDEIVAADAEIRGCDAELRTLETSLEPSTRRLADLAAAAETASASLAAALDAVDEAGGRQQEAATQVALLELCEQRARLTVERHGLGARCGRIEGLVARIASLEAERKGLATIGSDDVARLDQLERARDAAVTTLEAIATRVELTGGPGPVTLAGAPLEAAGGLTITAESELVIGPPGGETVLRISPGGGRSLADAARARDRADRELAAALTGLRITSVADARRVHARLQAIEADLEAKRGAIDGLGGDRAIRDLESLVAKIASVEAEIERRGDAPLDALLASPGSEPADEPADDASHPALRRAEAIKTAVHARLVGAHAARDAAATDTARATAAATAARRRLEEIAATRRQVTEAIQTSRGAIDSLGARRQLLLERFGADRDAAIRERTEAARAAAATAKATQDRLATLDPDFLGREQARLERAIAALQGQQQESETRRQVARDRLRREGTTDPREDVARATVRRRLAAARLTGVRREAEATKLLARLFAAKKRDVETQFAAPLTSRVADYLRTLFGPDTVVDVGYAEGRFQRLAVARGGFGNVTWEFGQLSGGTREQVAAAFRLAMAEILAAGHDGSLPVIFDDAFTNADEDRQRSLQRLLDLAAERGLQVIVFSCSPGDYAGLGARQVALGA